jgi:Zn-dependent protease
MAKARALWGQPLVASFLCVLLHEFGHSLLAQRLGIRIHSITLLPIGGVSNMEILPEKLADEVKITIAGPLVSRPDCSAGEKGGKA